MRWNLYRRGKIYWGQRTVEGVCQRRTTSTNDRRAAELTVRNWELEELDPGSHPENQATLGEALGRLITDRKTRARADGTISMYTQKSAHLVRLIGGDLPLNQLSAAIVDDYLTTRIEEGAHRNTVSKEITTLRGALRIAKRRGELTKGLDELLPIGWSAEHVPRKRALTLSETWSLLAELPPMRAAQIALIIATGARLSESDRLHREDFDQRAWTVRIRGTKTPDSDAVIPVPPLGRPLVVAALSAFPEHMSIIVWSWTNIRRDLAIACKRAGIERCTPNDLRRTCSSWMIQAGVSTLAVSRVLRHRDTRMIERVYGRMATGELKSLIDASFTVPVVCTDAAKEAVSSVGSGAGMLEFPAVLVPRGGIEPSTRGFSSPVVEAASVEEKAAIDEGGVHTVCIDERDLEAPFVEASPRALAVSRALRRCIRASIDGEGYAEAVEHLERLRGVTYSAG